MRDPIFGGWTAIPRRPGKGRGRSGAGGGALIVILALGCPAGPAAKAVDWRPAPEIRFRTLSGKTAELSDYRGKLVMVNFWAPWCAPCRKEIPDLQAFHAKYPDTVVLGLAVEFRDRESVRRMVERMDITYPVGFADRRTAAKLGGYWALPATFYITPGGRLVGRHGGPIPPDLMETYRERILELEGPAKEEGEE